MFILLFLCCYQVIQLTVYILALVLALCISVPLIIHQQDFKLELLLSHSIIHFFFIDYVTFFTQ